MNVHKHEELDVYSTIYSNTQQINWKSMNARTIHYMAPVERTQVLSFYPLQNITIKLNSSSCYYHFNLPTGSSCDMTKIISIYDALKLLKNSVER